MPTLEFDEPEAKPALRKKPLALILIAAVIAAVLAIGYALASNITINGGTPVNFGQGVTKVVACSGQDFVRINLASHYTNGGENSSFKLNSLTLSHIPYKCWGKKFTFQVVGDNKTILDIDGAKKSISATYEGGDSFSDDGLITNAIGTRVRGSYGAFTLEITTPVAISNQIKDVMVISSDGIPRFSNLVAYWNFNNREDLGNSTDGIFNLQKCGAPRSGDGLDGTRGLQLNGSSYLSNSSTNIPALACNLPTATPIPASLLGNAQYSITAWFKTSGGNYAGGIMGWGTPGCGNTTNLRINGFNAFSEYWWNCDFVPQINSGSFDDNQWHFVVSTYNGTERSIYFDGVNIGVDAPGVLANFQQGPFVIGATINDSGLNGTLDNVAVFSRALSTSEIKSLYQTHSTIPKANAEDS